MLDPWKRWIQFHELYLKSEPEEAPRIDLSTLVPIWIQRINNKAAVKLINRETAAIRIADVRHDVANKALILLLHYTDKNVTDPAFSHLETGSLRIEPKLDGEGIAVSAHVVLALDTHDTERMLYWFLLEEVPGLGRSRVSEFIRSELKIISEGLFEYQDADSNNATRKYLPAAEILGTPTKSFTDELGDGCVIKSIDLVKFSKGSSQIDEEGFYVESSRQMKLIPEPGALISELWYRVKTLANNHGYNDIKFRYKHPTGKHKTATMNSTESDIIDSLVLRSESVQSDEMLDQCSIKLINSMVKNMVKLLRSST